MIDTTHLVSTVATTRGIGPSVKVAFTELKALLDAELANDPQAQKVVDDAIVELLAHNQEIADAIVAHNPTPIPATP